MSNDKTKSVNGEQTAESGRGRSTIDFPYFDQDDAVAVAEAVHAVGGTSCDWAQLAAQMKQAPGGGSFRMRVMTARTFGLLNYDRGSVTLTDLGIHAVDQKFARAARVESFLVVPLFKAMYDKFKGAMLPPPAAIERAMEQFGVTPKTKEKARQVFMRSAKQAGFFDIDPDRLTNPPTAGSTISQPTTPGSTSEKLCGNGGNGTDGSLPPFIKGLLEKLPTPETEWPLQARVKWLQTAANIFDLMYKSDEQGKSITVSLT